MDYARKNKAEYLVLETQSENITREVMLLPMQGVQIVGYYESQNTPLKVGFYRFNPN